MRGWLVTNEHLPITVTHSVRTDRAVPPLVSAEFPLKGIRLAAVERDLLGKALKQAKNNKSQAVTVLGLGQGQFYSLLKRHGMTDAKR